MLNAQSAADIGRTFWDTFCAGDLDTCASTLADDILRIGPHDGVGSDTIRGKADYMQFLQNIKATMPTHDGVTYDSVGSPDGRRAYVHIMELNSLTPGSTETLEAKVVLKCDINDAGKIAVIDIFWKTPPGNHWVEASNLNKQAEQLR